MKKKHFLTSLISLTLVGVLFLPSQTHAQVLPFGGLVSFSIPCTCSAGMRWVWHTPLFLGGPIAITGPVVYSPFSTVPYPHYLFGVPSTWDLGSYIPGVQACWMYAVVACFPLYSIGLMTMTGTSVPI